MNYKHRHFQSGIAFNWILSLCVHFIVTGLLEVTDFFAVSLFFLFNHSTLIRPCPFLRMHCFSLFLLTEHRFYVPFYKLVAASCFHYLANRYSDTISTREQYYSLDHLISPRLHSRDLQYMGVVHEPTTYEHEHYRFPISVNYPPTNLDV